MSNLEAFTVSQPQQLNEDHGALVRTLIDESNQLPVKTLVEIYEHNIIGSITTSTQPIMNHKIVNKEEEEAEIFIRQVYY